MKPLNCRVCSISVWFPQRASLGKMDGRSNKWSITYQRWSTCKMSAYSKFRDREDLLRKSALLERIKFLEGKSKSTGVVWKPLVKRAQGQCKLCVRKLATVIVLILVTSLEIWTSLICNFCHDHSKPFIF